MKRLLVIELRRFRINVITLITFGLILIMYITQCLPEKWYWYAKPMDEIHFMYTIMVQDYSRGHTEEFKAENQILCSKIYLTKSSKELLLKKIRHMNPNYTEKDIISDIIFTVTQEEFEDIMDELNQVLGGKSYYAESMRSIYYSQYISNAFHIDTRLNISDMLLAMEEYLKYTVNEKSYSKYTNLFIKKLKFTSDELSYITNIYAKMVSAKEQGLDTNVIFRLYDDWFNGIDNMLGGNTAFGTKYRQYILNLNNNLEDEMKYFESIKNEEKITNAYARYYSDYMVILAGILPAIFGAFTLIEDRRYKMHELVYSKPVNSTQYVLSKFLSIVILFGIYYYLIASISTILFYRFGQAYNLNVDNLAFFKYITFWVMPTVLFTTALSMLLSVLFNNGIIAIVIQLIIFFMSAQPLSGEYKLYRPIIRYNQIGDVDFFRSSLHSIITNRIGISIISIAIVLIAIKTYATIRKKGVLLDILITRLSNIQNKKRWR